MEDDIIKDDEGHIDEPIDPDLDLDGEKKKKDLLDEDTDSLEDLADDELEVDKEDLMDDVDEI